MITPISGLSASQNNYNICFKGNLPQKLVPLNDTQKAMVEEYAPKILKRVRRIIAGTNPELRKDMVQEVNLAVTNCARTYDEQLCEDFMDYAKHRVIGAIKDYFRKSNGVMKYPRKYQSMKTFEEEFMQNNDGRQPSYVDFMKKFGLSKDVVARSVDSSCKYLDDPASGTNGPTIKQILAGKKDEKTAIKETMEYINYLTRQINPKYQSIVRLYLYSRIYKHPIWTMKELGSMFGVSESRISQIVNKYLRLLRARLANEGEKAAPRSRFEKRN